MELLELHVEGLFIQHGTEIFSSTSTYCIAEEGSENFHNEKKGTRHFSGRFRLVEMLQLSMSRSMIFQSEKILSFFCSDKEIFKNILIVSYIH